MNKSNPQELTANWQKYCRAYVAIIVDPRRIPHIEPEGFDGTRNARIELQRWGTHHYPTLADLDERLHTSLLTVETDPINRAKSAIVEAELALLSQGNLERHVNG